MMRMMLGYQGIVSIGVAAVSRYAHGVSSAGAAAAAMPGSSGTRVLPALHG
jgi:hypothetical protein